VRISGADLTIRFAMRFAVSIAGSDPTGGAGLQADLQVFRSHAVQGGGVPTALTVQDGRKVRQVLPVFPSVVLAQIRGLFGAMRPDAVKLGMLATDDVARSVALGLAALPADRPPIVVDPVLHASDGTPLLERRAYGTLQEMLRGAALVTPNLAEAEALTGHAAATREGAERAARFFVADLGAEAALVKGGHREGDADDLLAWRDGTGVALRWLPGERLAGGGAHGTGCALSAAIAARLALGDALLPAVESARAFVRAALANAVERGGARFLGIP
jgi:hydroxymethylpyrimidine kinase/phosphomethylpyrimidine kinase